MKDRRSDYHAALRVRELLRHHLMCDIAALIGQACADLGDVVPDIARALGEHVRQATGSAFLGACAEKVVEKWILTFPPVAASVQQVKLVGKIADTLAVALCPAVPRHREVEMSEQRLDAAVTAEWLQERLGGHAE